MTTCGVRPQAGKGSLRRRPFQGLASLGGTRIHPPGERTRRLTLTGSGEKVLAGGPLGKAFYLHGYWGLWP